MGFLTRIVANLFSRPQTEAFPLGAATTPKSYRGRIEVDAEACVGCSTCAQVCVGNAIDLTEEADGIRLMVWHARCVFCGLCAFYCPTKAITQTNDWNLGHRNADKYTIVEDILAPYRTCGGCGSKLMVPRVGVFAAEAVGRERNDAAEPLCDACRRKVQARQIIGGKR